MSARDDKAAVLWAKAKVYALLNAGDKEGARRVWDWGYKHARGSNHRKELLGSRP